MFALLLVIIDVVVTIMGVYLFDFKVDGVINNPLVIILSLLAGAIAALIVFFAYIEVFYLLVGRHKPKDYRIKHVLAKQIMTVPLLATNTRVKVDGLENLPKDPGFTIYANHTSMMDIAVLMYKIYHYPVAFLSKKEVGDLFSIGKWTTSLGSVMLDRENSRKGAEAILEVIKNVKSGLSMVVFPEGTRSRNIGELLPFKPGSFKVALKSKAPLVPITIVKPMNFKKIKWPMPKRITLVIHPAIPYNDFKTMSSNELAKHVRDIMIKPLMMNGD